MEFGFTEEQEMIRSQAAEFLKTEYPIALVRELMENEHGYNQDLWEKMTAMGWLGLIFPEEYGGTGLTFVELTVLLEEMGRALVPGTFFSAVLLAGLTLLEAASEEQKKCWLTSLVEGRLKATLALTEPNGSWKAAGVSTVTAERGDGEYIISGTKLFVPDAQVSDLIICAARTGASSVLEEGISLFAMDRNSDGLKITPLKTMDQTRRVYEVSLERVRVPANRVLGGLGRAWPVIERVLNRATIGICAEMVGGAQKMLDMCVDYAKQRIQFGRPIGSFQAIQHKCADMLLLIESARSAVYAAAWAASKDGQDTALLASVAKAYTSDAYRFVTGEGIQIHGGMGFTWEHDAHLYFKRAKADEFNFGDANYHRARVAQFIGL
jgi:alkylation response protein AidB-like acyl-CoA dehydrogenase